MHRSASLRSPASTRRPRHLRRSPFAAVALATALVAGVGGAVAADGTSHRGGGRSGQVVQTANGAVKGVRDGGHRVFHGVPYAAPPVDDLRWKPPRRAAGWDGVRNAAKPGSGCVQTAVAWRPAAASTDEDCLNLNVWTPAKARKGAKRPVAVWFHGGGSVNGAGRDFEPVTMVDKGDLIVVTVNYRLGALGHLTLPQLDAVDGADSSGNYSLLDQMAALRWVKDNIARFGGDPSQVMIAGQSAGGSAVCGLLASPKAAGLFSSAVIQSSTCGATSREEAQRNNADFVTALGCDAPQASKVVTCLRGKTPAEIVDAQQDNGSWSRVTQKDVLPATPRDAFRSGDFNRVPVLLGGTSHEDRAFVYEQHDLVSQPVTEAVYTAAVREEFGADADEVLARYPASAYKSPGAALAQVRTDGPRVCSAQLPMAAELTKTVPTYVYEFRDETAPLRPYQLVPSSFSLATQHSAELPYLWGSNSMKPLTRKQQRLSRDMVAYWAQFARTGSLAPGGLAAVPRYDAAKPRQVAFGSAGPRLVGDMADRHKCSFWTALS